MCGMLSDQLTSDNIGHLPARTAYGTGSSHLVPNTLVCRPKKSTVAPHALSSRRYAQLSALQRCFFHDDVNQIRNRTGTPWALLLKRRDLGDAPLVTTALKRRLQKRLHDLLVDGKINKATREAYHVAVVVLTEELGKGGRGDG